VRACVAEIRTPAYKGPSVRGNVVRKKHVDGVMQRGLYVKRVMHAVAVETTTHPVVRRHVKNNMVLALLSSHCPPVRGRVARVARVGEQNELRSRQHSGFVAVRVRARRPCRKQNLWIQARIPQA
jgi:hypothetical protein